jgi:di/tricarboxylate transporter
VDEVGRAAGKVARVGLVAGPLVFASMLAASSPAGLSGGKGRGPVLTWEMAGRLPWNVLLLFGGGLSLADAIGRSGLAAWIGGGLSGVGRWPDFAVAIAATSFSPSTRRRTPSSTARARSACGRWCAAAS